MKNFKEIAEKCLKGELSGHFILRSGGTLHSNRLQKLGFYLFTQWRYTYNEIGECINGQHCWDIIKFESNINKENDKRTIQISLQQAREWYNSGNDTLKTLALSSFSKKEIDLYPRSWNEYLENHPGNLVHAVAPENLGHKLTVYGVLLVLRKEWIHIWSQEQGLKKDWKVVRGESNFSIMHFPDEQNCEIVLDYFAKKPLVFPDFRLATDFKNTFKNLLEQAKGLY